MRAFEGISDQGDRFHPLTGRDARDSVKQLVRTGGSTGNIGSFGMTRDGGAKMHKGVDWLVADPGVPVFAAHEGVVTIAGEQVSPGPKGAGFGLRVYLDAPGGQLRTVYAHLAGLAVQERDRVKPGYLLGWVGRSGNINRDVPTHLHFEVHLHNVPVNPEDWLLEPPEEQERHRA